MGVTENEGGEGSCQALDEGSEGEQPERHMRHSRYTWRGENEADVGAMLDDLRGYTALY